MIMKHARRHHRRLTAVSALLIAASLGGCAGVAPILGPAPDTLARQAEQRVAGEDFGGAIDLYRQAAQRSEEPQRSRYYLRAGNAAISTGDGELAKRLFDKVQRKALDTEDRTELDLARLRARVAGMPPEQALETVSPPGPSASPAIAAGTWQLRAELLREADRPVDAVHALVQRDVWLLEPDAVRANDEWIWDILTSRPEVGRDREAISAADETTRGWLQLAAIGQREDGDSLKDALAAWEQRHPGHPATRHVLPEAFDYKPTMPETADTGPGARTVGLALPLSGDFAGAAAVVRDGFLAGYFEQSEPRPNLHIYDTTRFPDMQALLSRAASDGAGVLVGPLAKSDVSALTSGAEPPMAVVALNYIDTDDRFPGFYQFGLAPEDEARAAARRAVAKGWRRGLALVPETDWGDRVLEAFRDGMQYAGGKLIDHARFNPEQQDHAAAIKRVLRYTGTSGSGNGDGDGERGRRQDADFMFVAAQPGQARLLRTQLRFYRATQLPVLATSHVYTGTVNPDRDSDLNGLMFADMPWVLGTGDADLRRRRLGDDWSDASGGGARLFAMGLDAWTLAERIRDDALRPGTLFAGATGELYLEPDGQVRRRLDWARFVKGKPEPLPRRDTIVLPGRERTQLIPAGGGHDGDDDSGAADRVD